VKRAFAVAAAALADERKRPAPKQRDRDELEFLPAAVEIVETPASPTARGIFWLLILFFAIALTWSWFGEVDVVAVAEGRLMPGGRVKVIQPLEIGTVRAIHVQDGKAVKQGDVLVELDTTASSAERERLLQELQTKKAIIARTQALASSTTPAEAERSFVPPTGADPGLIATQRRLLISEMQEHTSRLAALKDELARRKSERAGIETAIKRLDQTIPLLVQRRDARSELADKGYGSKLTYWEAQQLLVEHEQERVIQRHKLAETAATLAALDNQRQQTEAEFRRTKLAELNDAERQAASLAQELVKAEQRQGLQTLSSPIDGVVQQLAVHTVGGVVTPAQALMVVVPADDTIEVEAMVPNKDIGFIHPGQEAEVKLETFPFTRYGTIPGNVVSVSSDAIVDEKRGPIYAARIRLSRATIDIDGRTIRLGSGMNATVEIKTDKRRLIEFLLSPVRRYRQESLRER
jgi:hemolysin D